MRPQLTIRCWAILALLAAGSPGVVAQDKPASERFLAEAPKAWAEVEARATRLHVAGVEWQEFRDTAGFSRASEFRFEVKAAPGGRGLSVHYPAIRTTISGTDPPRESNDAEGYRRIWGFNPDEAFQLVRKAEGAPFVPSVGVDRDAPKRAVEGYVGFVWQPASFRYDRGTPPDPNFRLGKIEDVTIDGRDYVRVAYEHQIEVDGQPYVYRDAWALLRPAAAMGRQGIRHEGRARQGDGRPDGY